MPGLGGLAGPTIHEHAWEPGIKEMSAAANDLGERPENVPRSCHGSVMEVSRKCRGVVEKGKRKAGERLEKHCFLVCAGERPEKGQRKADRTIS